MVTGLHRNPIFRMASKHSAYYCDNPDSNLVLEKGIEIVLILA